MLQLLTTPLLLVILPLMLCAVGYLLWRWAKRIVARHVKYIFQTFGKERRSKMINYVQKKDKEVKIREREVAEEEEERRREEMANRPRLPSLQNV